MGLFEYIKNNKRKISFSIMTMLIIIFGIISTYGVQLGIPSEIIGYAVIISGVFVGITGKSWKDYFKDFCLIEDDEELIEDEELA